MTCRVVHTQIDKLSMYVRCKPHLPTCKIERLHLGQHVCERLPDNQCWIIDINADQAHMLGFTQWVSEDSYKRHYSAHGYFGDPLILGPHHVRFIAGPSKPTQGLSRGVLAEVPCLARISPISQFALRALH